MSDQSHNWTTLTTADNEALAKLLEERLQAAGIPAVLIPGDASSYMGASSPTAVTVPTDQLKAAQEMLND